MDPTAALRKLLEQSYPLDRLRPYVREARQQTAECSDEDCAIALVSIVLFSESAESAHPSGCRVQVALGKVQQGRTVSAEHGFASLFFDVDGRHVSTELTERMRD